MFLFFCVVLSYDGLIACPRSPTKISINRFTVLEANFKLEQAGGSNP